MTGSLQSQNYPNSPYPTNTNCEWTIQCPEGSTVDISFSESFRVAGSMPTCPRSQLTISGCNTGYGPYCHVTAPSPFTTTCDNVKVSFVAGSTVGTTRTGFQLNYSCKRTTTQPPPTTIVATLPTTTPPPTATPPTTTTPPPSTTPPPMTTTAAPLQLPQCGGGFQTLTAMSGSLQTQNYPNSAYPTNTNCEWNIQCPEGSTVDISFSESFRVAGSMPTCPRSQLTISGCNTGYGPYCHVTAPSPFTTTCDNVKVSFVAGSTVGTTRTGFQLNYSCKRTTTQPPPTTIVTTLPTTTPTPTTTPPPSTTPPPMTTTAAPLQLPQCGGGFQTLTAMSGSLQTQNYPNSAYPTNTNCEWNIQCPDNSVIDISFASSFRLAGRMPECPRSQLTLSGCNNNYGPYCHLTPPSPFTTTCNMVKVNFKAGSTVGGTRTGFQLNYVCKAAGT